MTDPDINGAFALGCDAHHTGCPIQSHPYRQPTHQDLHQAWRNGWLDVDNLFGVKANGSLTKPAPVNELRRATT